MDDSRTVVLSLRANEAISAWPGKTLVPTLVLRCLEGEISTLITVGTPTNPETGEGLTVQLRFDRDPPSSALAHESTDREALFLENPKDLIPRMLTARAMRFRFTPFNSPPQETSFSLSGLSRVIKTLQTACTWDPEGEKEAESERKEAESERKREEARAREKEVEEKARIDQERLDGLLRDLDAPESMKRGLAIAGLADYGPRAKPAVAKLIEALRDKSWGIRAATVEALGKIGPPASDAIPALEAAAADPSLGIVGGAQGALKRIRSN